MNHIPHRSSQLSLPFIFLLPLLFCFQVSFAATTPTYDFLDNGDGTVTHKSTGLMWMRCSMGQTWSGSTCLGTVSVHTWHSAMALTSGFAGYSDWRLPNHDELVSIVDNESSKTEATINLAIFPETKRPNPNPNTYFNYWSSSPYPYLRGDDYAWGVSFEDGGAYSEHVEHPYCVRLVRGGQWTLGSVPLLTEAQKEQFAKQEREEIARRAEQDREEAALQAKREREREAKIQKFRKSIKEGDDTTDGVVIQIKGSLIKIQTNESQCTQRDYDGGCRNYVNTPAEKWFKKNEIYPRD